MQDCEDEQTAPQALIYTRISREDPEHLSLGLASQRAICRRYAIDRGWQTLEVFEDVMSGARDDRAGYQRLLETVRHCRQHGRRVHVVVASLDRLARRMVEALRCRLELRSLEVPVLFVRDGGEISDLVAHVMAAVAQEEVRQTSVRVRGAFHHRARAGWYASSNCPWGYLRRLATEAERADGAGRTVLDRDPVTAPVLASLFARVAAGERPAAAARWVAALSPEQRAGHRYSLVDLLPVLRSPVYVARPHAGDPEVLARRVGRWPALVDDATWHHVEQVLQLPPVDKSSDRYVLAHLIRCMRCGRRARGQPYGGKQPPSFVCPSCGAYVGPTTRLDPAVRREVLDLLAQVAGLGAGASAECAWEAERAAPTLLVREQRMAHWRQAQSMRARRRLRKAAALWVGGQLDTDGYELVRTASRAQLEESQPGESRPGLLETALPAWADVLARAERWEYELQAGSVGAQRRALAELLERVDPVRLRRCRYRVRLTWTVLGESLRAVVRRASAEA